ncbi:MAG: hypothetical protein ACLQVM_27675 [Terriglobia bacterium]
MELNIIGGDPQDGRASYARFVLPFCYQPVPLSGSWTGLAYQEITTSNPVEVDRMRARSDYFTAETSRVLFDRAKWMELTDAPNGTGLAPKDFEVEGRQIQGEGRKRLKVRLKPARVALFEWPNAEHLTGEPDLLAAGFLIQDAYFLEGSGKWGLEDLLAFDDMFRYWRCPFQGFADIDHDGFRYRRLVPDANCRGDVFFDRWAPLLHYPVRMKDQDQLWWLFPGASDQTGWSADARRWALEGGLRPGWVAYADTRTFVWTCGLLEKGMESLRESAASSGSDARGVWVKLLNVDSPGDNIFSLTKFEKQWLKARTYRRWEEFGTVYGFSYHSGAMIASPKGRPPVWRHFADMYFDLVLLLLYLRIGSFRFSRRLNEISELMRNPQKGNLKRFTEDFRSLREAFALFANLYQYPLLSNQQQGLEMYEIARKNLDVNELFLEVQDKIKATHDYLETRTSQEQVDTTVGLTVVATIGLAIVLTLNFLALDIVKHLKDFLRGMAENHPKLLGWVRVAGSLSRDFILLACTLLFFLWVTRLVSRNADMLLRWLKRDRKSLIAKLLKQIAALVRDPRRRVQ